jgi:O-antigen/teichoic acid export membrane protein
MQLILKAAHRAGQIVRTNGALLSNSVALATGTGVTAAIGFLFWWVAARYFAPQAVGLASAAISMMNFLALFAEFGLGTLLIGESLRKPDEPAGLISAAMLTATAFSTIFCLGYLAAAQVWPLTIGSFLGSRSSSVIFLAGCAVTGFTLVLDSAFVGLLRSSLQMWRSIAASALKLAFLVSMALAVGASRSETAIILSLVGGQFLSVLLIAAFLASRGRRVWHAPRFGLLRPHAFDVLGHHLLNLAAQSPGLIIPLLVTTLISAEVNAVFFTAWMVLNVVLLGPASLTTLLFTFGAVEPASINQRLRFSLLICALFSAVAWLGLTIGSSSILGVFGPLYAERGAPILKIMGLAVFAVSIKYHFIAVQRLNNCMAAGSLMLGAGAVLELVLAAAGGRFNGVLGFAQGWVLAVCLEALVMAPALLRIAPIRAVQVGGARQCVSAVSGRLRPTGSAATGERQ